MRVVVIILAILAFIACLVIGLQVGVSHPFDHPPTQVPTLQAGQKIDVIFLVDDLQSPQPKLLNTWIVITDLDRVFMNLILLSPAMAKGDQAFAESLERNFAVDQTGQPTSEFMVSFKLLNIKMEGYYVIDETGLATIIDWLGGIDTNGSIQSGQDVFSSLCLDCKDAKQRLENTQNLFKGLCQQATHLNGDADWMPIFTEITPKHFQTNRSFSSMIADWGVFAASGTPLTCEVSPIE